MQERLKHAVKESGRSLWARLGKPSLRHVSIATKLALIIGSLAMVSAGVLLIMLSAGNVTAGVRAFVSGESLYSKGQKDAVYSLVRYMRSRSGQDYQNYLDAISIPLGDSRARVELQKPEFDYDAAASGFLAGGNAPEDIPYLISLFRRFQDTSYMRTPINLWTQADAQIAELVKCADEVHQAVITDRLSGEREAEFLQRIDRINLAAGTLQREFSAQLGRSARQVRGLLFTATVLTAATLLSAALWLSWRISREFRANIFNLRTAAIKVAQGDLDHRAEVRSRDELGDLTMVFNQMVEQRMGAEQELRSAAEFREKVMYNVTNAIYVIDLEGRFVMVNRGLCTMTGYAEHELVGMLFDEFFPPERIPDLREIFEGILLDGALVERYEAPMIRKDKQIITISYSSAPFYRDGKIVGVVGAAEDVTERRLHDERIARLANYDTLTGLPNRNLLNDRIAQALARALRHGTPVALLFMDVDGFKFINDSLGHAAGDELLRQVALRLESCVRKEDTVARLGGDEFVVMLCDFEDEFDVLNIANKILRSFGHPLVIDSRNLHVTTSIGLSFYPRDGQNHDTLLKHADIAMYRAKEAGRNCMKCFTMDMAVRTEERVELEGAMREALEKVSFRLHYQPQFDLNTGKICSAEALMRWHHPSMGNIAPARFIPLAEETGLIMPMGEWALRTACRELKVWHQLGHPELSVAVNLSSHQFMRPGLINLVKEVLAETGVPPACLHLELTEGVILQGSEAVIGILRELKRVGVVLALDDFGTGYSSLAYLRRFPIDILKIDQSFVLDLIVDPEAATIIRAILAMARSLNMKTIAEGVETKEQLNFLASYGCDVMQGFYLSRALPADEFRALLTTRQESKLNAARPVPESMS